MTSWTTPSSRRTMRCSSRQTLTRSPRQLIRCIKLPNRGRTKMHRLRPASSRLRDALRRQKWSRLRYLTLARHIQSFGILHTLTNFSVLSSLIIRKSVNFACTEQVFDVLCSCLCVIRLIRLSVPFICILIPSFDKALVKSVISLEFGYISGLWVSELVICFSVYWFYKVNLKRFATFFCKYK